MDLYFIQMSNFILQSASDLNFILGKALIVGTSKGNKAFESASDPVRGKPESGVAEHNQPA